MSSCSSIPCVKLRSRIGEVDSDGSGTIDFDEFQRWYAELMGIDAWTGQGEELRTSSAYIYTSIEK